MVTPGQPLTVRQLHACLGELVDAGRGDDAVGRFVEIFALEGLR